MIKIFTDGACSGNPGIGGWGAVIIENKETLEIHGGLDDTTNNQMELIATIEALKLFNERKKITLYTDSKYVKDGITSWIKKWKNNNWKTVNKKDVKNKKLWILLDNQMQKHEIIWEWVKGHEGNYYNEKADGLARQYIEKKI